jgi:hypothetical protein
VLGGDAINIMLAAAAFNFKRAIRILLRLIHKGLFALRKVQHWAWNRQGVTLGGDSAAF